MPLRQSDRFREEVGSSSRAAVGILTSIVLPGAVPGRVQVRGRVRRALANRRVPIEPFVLGLVGVSCRRESVESFGACNPSEDHPCLGGSDFVG